MDPKTDIEKRVEKLVAENREYKNIINNARPVLATADNTKSVRDGMEQGGYVKYYIVETASMNELNNLLANKHD